MHGLSPPEQVAAEIGKYLPSRWQKLHRGEAHLNTFKAELAQFAAPENRVPVGIRQKLDRDGQAWVCSIASVPECPPHWGLLIGEAIHNLRGALDHLVWDLAILHSQGEPLDPKGRPWRTQFPICANKPDWKTSGIQKMVRPIGDMHRTLIEGRQPYHGWQGDRTHPLLALEKLSNTDKHRTLQPAVLAAGELEISHPLESHDCHVLGSGGVAFVAGRPLKANTELLRIGIEITGPNPKMDVEFKLRVRIGFPDGAPVEETLEDIVAFVRETLSMVEGDLTTPNAIELRERVEASHWAIPPWLPTEWRVKASTDER